jgi:hypothetical protein
MADCGCKGEAAAHTGASDSFARARRETTIHGHPCRVEGEVRSKILPIEKQYPIWLILVVGFPLLAHQGFEASEPVGGTAPGECPLRKTFPNVGQ